MGQDKGGGVLFLCFPALLPCVAPLNTTMVGSARGWMAGRSLTGKKKCSGTSFPKKAHGHSLCSTMVGGGWRLAVGGGWRLAVGNWRLVAVGGGWWRLVVGDWWLVAVGSGLQLAAGGGWWLAVGGNWRLMGVGGWRLVVPWGGP